jgi:predicted metal-dependent phosphoesterase TrpH
MPAATSHVVAWLRRVQARPFRGAVAGLPARMSRYDLHSHSTASDGALSPTQLVERAHHAGVEVLALTDHDTLDGVAEARVAAAARDLALLAGVEVSVTWNGSTIHVLGLNVDPDNAALRDGLNGLQRFRDWRAGEIARRLAQRGIGGALEGALRFRRGRLLGRTHFAHFLVEAGHAATVRDVFKRFLVKDKPGYVHGQWTSLAQANGWIRDAGGMPVIAHPARYRLTRSKLKRLLGEFVELGGIGLEVVSGSHSLDETRCMAAVSREHRLHASCGSDYHGPENPWIDIGRLRALPSGCIPIWHAEEWPPECAA